jgi:hypothetical protein
MKVKYSCNYIFDTNPNRLKSGNWCPSCSKRLKSKEYLAFDLQHCLDDNGWDWLSGEYVDKRTHILIRCDKGHKIKMTPKSIKKGHNCHCCIGKCLDKNYHSRWLQYIIKSSKGIWVSGEYIDSNTKITVQCKTGHTFSTTPGSLKSGSWCPSCSACKSERECSELLTGYTFSKVRPKEFINPKTGAHLELDGYCQELHFAFEYQGEQHYRPSAYLCGDDCEEKFLEQQYRDRIKKQYCIDYNYLLLEIPYTVNSVKKEV